MTEEERKKAREFLDNLDNSGYIYTTDGRELYIVENVFNKINELQKEIEKKDRVINQFAKDRLLPEGCRYLFNCFTKEDVIDY